MPTLRLPLLDAKLMAAALLPHTVRHDVSALANVAVGHDIPLGGQFAVASDRYTCGRYDLTNVASIYPSEVMLIPVNVLSALLTIGPKTLMYSPIRYDAMIEVIAIDKTWEARLAVILKGENGDEGYAVHYMRVFRALDQTRPFPPVARLFDQWLPGEVTLNPLVLNSEYLSRFTTYARRTGSMLRLSIPPRKGDGKPTQGVLVEAGTRFKGIIMPYLYTVNEDQVFGIYPPDVNAAREAATALTAEASLSGRADIGEPSQDADSPEPPDDTVSSGR